MYSMWEILEPSLRSNKVQGTAISDMSLSPSARIKPHHVPRSESVSFDQGGMCLSQEGPEHLHVFGLIDAAPSWGWP